MVKLVHLIGSLAVGLNIISLIPQIYKTHVSKNTKGLSYEWLFISAIASFLWVAYAVIRNDTKLAVGSFSFLLSYIILISQKYYFEKSYVESLFV